VIVLEFERVVVIDEGLYVGNGLVHRWMIGVGNRLYQNTVHNAPERTGALKAGITLDFDQDAPSLRVLDAVVSSTAPHTPYVIHGTAGGGTGYIYRHPGFESAVKSRLVGNVGIDTTGMWMRLSDSRNGLHLRVRGQRPNNFMLAGYNATARTHRALHPMFPGFVS